MKFTATDRILPRTPAGLRLNGSASRALALVLILPVGAAFAPPAASQDKKPPAPKLPPRAILVAPMGAIPGKPAKLTLIGLRLDNATAVRFADPKAKPAIVKILNKKKTPPNQRQDANRIGDSQVEIELSLAVETMESSVALVVETPDGVSNSVRLMVDKPGAVTPEKEPNNGFAQSQPVQLGSVIAGSIGQNQDVDVFRFEGKEGQRVVFDVVAARYGSALEPMLTLYDAAGRIVATSEEGSECIDLKLPKAGTYHLGLIDAHDQGGPAYVYRLMVRAD